VRELVLDLGQEVPSGGAIGHVVAGQPAFVTSRVKLAHDASLAVARVPDKGARVSLGGKRDGSPVLRVVYSEFDRRLADFVEGERLEACVSSDGEVGSIAVFTDDEAALAFFVELCWGGEVGLRRATLDPELSPRGKLERGRTAAQRTK
jgi:hypothetical protein